MRNRIYFWHSLPSSILCVLCYCMHVCRVERWSIWFPLCTNFPLIPSPSTISTPTTANIVMRHPPRPRTYHRHTLDGRRTRHMTLILPITPFSAVGCPATMIRISAIEWGPRPLLSPLSIIWLHDDRTRASLAGLLAPILSPTGTFRDDVSNNMLGTPPRH